MQDKSILGIDISKKTFNVCLLTDKKERHKVFQNNHTGFEQCLGWCKSHGASKLWFCLEATSWYGEELSEYMTHLGHAVSIINPARIKAYAQSKGLRQKTDKADAGVIADFCRVHQPTTWNPPSKEERYLRDLCRSLEDLKESQRSLANRLENTRLHEHVRGSLTAIMDAYNQEIKNLEKRIKNSVNQSLDLKGKVDFLTQIKGVGFLTAITLLTEIPNIKNFENVREYVAFSGLNPRQYSSGSSVRGKQRISKIGSQRVRKALFMPALVIKNKNPHFRDFCNRLTTKGKCAKVIIVAVMRKLMHIIFGMLKNNTPFDHTLAFRGES